MDTKTSLTDEFFALDPQQRRTVHLLLCKYALAKWESHMNAHGPIKYMNSVVGTLQQVDQKLPFDSFMAARQAMPSPAIAHRYGEPIAAMQDDDLTFPENITFAYYAIYNLFQKYAENRTMDDWLIVNQALSSEEDPDQWRVLLIDAIQRAMQ